MIETAKSVDSVIRQPESSRSAESRLDPLTGQWTIFAPQRDQRPDEFKVTRQIDNSVTCPFCQGQEDATPTPVWIGKADDNGVRIEQPVSSSSALSSDWSVRVVPNKYPAVGTGDCEPSAGSAPDRDPALFQSRRLTGGHEVIVESPLHVDSPTQLDQPEVALVFKAYRDRLSHWRNTPGIKYISVFKNVGGDAGASLKHSHSQLIAPDRVPATIAQIVSRMQHHQATTGCCLQCDLIRGELKAKLRVIAQTESLVAYCPFASRLPMLVRISTKSHQPRFENLTEPCVEEVSRLFVRVVGWLERLLPGTSYNHLLHTQPPGVAQADAYHWSLDIFPRLTQIAGFEWSSDCMINAVLPEHAAKRFRALAAAEDPRLIL